MKLTKEVINLLSDLNSFKFYRDESFPELCYNCSGNINGATYALGFKADTNISTSDLRFLTMLFKAAVNTTILEHFPDLKDTDEFLCIVDGYFINGKLE